MSNWPVMRGGRVIAPFIDGEYPGLGLPTPTANNTLTPWMEVVASLPVPVDGVEMSFEAGGGDNSWRGLVDLGVGAPLAEVPVVSGVLTGAGAYREGPSLARIPVRIPAGRRVVVRWQSSQIVSSGGGGGTPSFGMRFFTAGGAYPVGGRISTHGADYANTGGVPTSILYGDPIPATELIASTPAFARGIIVRHALTGDNTNALNSAQRLFIGPPGAEVPLQDWVRQQSPSQELVLWTPIPAGSRISIRYRLNTTPNYLHHVAYLIH